MRIRANPFTFQSTPAETSDSEAAVHQSLAQPFTITPRGNPKSAKKVVFLSHVGAKPIVTHTSTCIKRYVGYDVKTWVDLQITGGKWHKTIQGKLEEASALVLVATPSVLSSVYAGFEIGYVDRQLGDTKVFILRIGTTTEELQRKPPLAEFQHYDATDPAGLRQFIVNLARELGVKTYLLRRYRLQQDSARFQRLASAQLDEKPSALRVA